MVQMVITEHDAQALRVDVWFLPLDAAYPADFFTEEDCERGRRFRFEADCLRASLSNRLLRRAAAELLGSDPDEVRITRVCVTCGQVGDHGRPVVMDEQGCPDPRVNLSSSHGGEWVGVAACSSVPVGIDIEPRSRALQDTDPRVLSPVEREELSEVPIASRGIQLLRTWVRKEAVLKATGFGLAIEPALLTISEQEVVGYPDQLAQQLSGGVRLFDGPTLQGHLTALAVLTASDVGIVVHPDGRA